MNLDALHLAKAAQGWCMATIYSTQGNPRLVWVRHMQIGG